MSRVLESALGEERRLECARNDAKLIAAMFQLDKGVRLDRGPVTPIPFHADVMHPVDLVIAAIEAGAQRVEVFPVLTPEMLRAGGLI